MANIYSNSNEERTDIYMDDITAFISKHEGEHEAKLKELQEWTKMARADVEKAKEVTKLIVGKSPFPKEWDGVVDDVMNRGVILACFGKVDGTPENWSCGDMGSRWLDYEHKLKYGKGKANVRITFASRKFGEVHESVIGYEYCLVFQVTYHLPACCLCRKVLLGFGNNPYPLRSEKEDCCNDCNTSKVIPARLKLMKQENDFLKAMSEGRIVGKAEKRKKKEVKITEEDIQREILKARKEAERKAKEEEEEKARKEAREKKRERSPEASVTAGVSIAQLTATKGKEDDEAKEIRRRAKEVRVKVKTRPSSK